MLDETLSRAAAWADGLAGPGRRPPAGGRRGLPRIRRLVLTDEVARTLFAEYAAHRSTDRGSEETGWVLLGRREAEAAVVTATLPAGAERDAGAAHVRFHGDAQAVAARVVRQADRRLAMLGVAHTHPGSLRHPSRGDLRGDREWVAQVRGRQGVFGIGTAAGREGGRGGGQAAADDGVSTSPAAHAQVLGRLRFDWYTLAAGGDRYEPVPVGLAIGPDLALPVRAVWAEIEANAGRLDRLARQFPAARWAVGTSGGRPALVADIPGGSPGQAVRVLLLGKVVRYFWDAGRGWTPFELPAGTAPDQGALLALAELAARG